MVLEAVHKGTLPCGVDPAEQQGPELHRAVRWPPDL